MSGSSSSCSKAPERRRKAVDDVDDFKMTELSLMKDVCAALKSRNNEQKKSEDFIDLFLKSLGEEIGVLPDLDQWMAINEVRQVIFKYQLKRLNNTHQSMSAVPETQSSVQKTGNQTPGPFLSEMLNSPFSSSILGEH